MKNRYSLKTNYFLTYSLIALFLVFTSCSKEENEIINETESTEVEAIEEGEEATPEELNFFENGGSPGLTAEEKDIIEDKAPEEGIASKSARYHCNYTLLKPADVDSTTVCGTTTTMPLLVGSIKKEVGEVTIANDEENLYLTFKAAQNKYMKKVYLYIGEKGSIPFYSNGFPNLRKFNYKAFPYYYGGMREATYVIPLSSINLDCFEIVAYAKVYDAYSNCFYSAFAYDKERTQEYYYSYYTGCYYFGDWVRSFEYCKQTCEVPCVQAHGYHDKCAFCENDVLGTFLAYVFIDRNGPEGFNVELITNPNGCDVSNSPIIGHVNIASIENTNKLKVEYHVNEGYSLCNVDFSYGTSTSNVNTSENVSASFENPVSTYSFEFEKLSGANIYMDIQAEVSENN